MGFGWLDVDQDVMDSRLSLADGILDPMGNFMPIPNRQISIDQNMQIHIVMQTHFANIADIQSGDTPHSQGRITNLLFHPVAWRSIHHLS